MCVAHCEVISGLHLVSEDISHSSNDQQTQSEVVIFTSFIFLFYDAHSSFVFNIRPSWFVSERLQNNVSNMTSHGRKVITLICCELKSDWNVFKGRAFNDWRDSLENWHRKRGRPGWRKGRDSEDCGRLGFVWIWRSIMDNECWCDCQDTEGILAKRRDQRWRSDLHQVCMQYETGVISELRWN